MLAYSAYAFAEDWGTSGVLAAYWQPILWVIVAVLLARAATVYLRPVLDRARHSPLLDTYYVLGGLRGAISLALALSLPESFGSDRVSLKMMAFGVVLFTLLVQSLSMEPFIRCLNSIERSEPGASTRAPAPRQPLPRPASASSRPC